MLKKCLHAISFFMHMIFGDVPVWTTDSSVVARNDVNVVNNSRTCTPGFPKVEFINAGISRTGTQTIASVFETKGFTVYNQQTLIFHQHYKNNKIFTCRYDEEIESMLQEVSSDQIIINDIPFNFCYKEIIEYAQRWNQAPVLMLTTRNADEWLHSFALLVHAFAPAAGFPFTMISGTRNVVEKTAASFKKHLNCSIMQWDDGIFVLDAYIKDKQACKEGFLRYNEQVREYASEHKLNFVEYNLDLLHSHTEMQSNKSVQRVYLWFIFVLTRVPFLVTQLLLACLLCWVFQ